MHLTDSHKHSSLGLTQNHSLDLTLLMPRCKLLITVSAQMSSPSIFPYRRTGVDAPAAKAVLSHS